MSFAPLYPYVPFASSLAYNRQSGGADSPVKIHVSFSPDWFAARMPLDYGERWHADPAVRRDSFAAMADALNREFPALMLGGDPKSIRGGISQIDTCAFIGALFGREILFGKAAWPENKGGMLSDEDADRLEVPRFEDSAVWESLMRQMDEIGKEWGAIDGELNYQGVLNTAFRLRGENIFMDMAAAPERAHHVLGVVCETMQRVADAVYARQLRSGVVKDYFVTANCVVNMISERHYRELVMPYDRALSGHWPHFGIHNCGWTVDAYAKAYSEIRPLGYLDFGIRSDLAALRRLFPRTTLTLILNPDDVIGKGDAELRVMLEGVRDRLGECRIVVGSLDATTPSRQVAALFDATADVWGVRICDLVPRPHYG